ncbi:sensor histidine kinase [Sphingomonas alba]|uniref:Sensor histidine kinase n=1 Tax=Sphingomonas alba TaxID=2908208 RepID=A0ABT0RIJ8_9SPHN|nr:sensor histidine kinase [Sphingomonas alba]MCL6682459.1 sensor histidine kinase [Sphingomonas alba]
MEFGPEPPVVLGHHPKDSPHLAFELSQAPAVTSFTSSSRHEFVATFRQIISGLPEQIALVDEHWQILAVNPAWIKTAAMYGYDSLTPGTDYLAFCDARARDGHRPAAIAVDGIRAMERNGDPSFRFTYHGKDRWEGFAFQLCVNRIEVGGRVMHTITRYDVTELVNLRQLREEFSHSLIEHQAEERRRIAREVHDSTMQLLAGLGLSIAHLKETKRKPKIEIQIVDEMEQLLGEAQRELRAISFLAHPPMVSELGLATAIRQLAGGFAKRTGLKITTNAEGDIHMSPAAEVAVYRMVQEALSNVHRHARASDVAVGVYLRRSMLHIAIVDNGIGMPEKVRKGVGLSSMRERIDEIGGRLMIRHGKPGTIIIASVPTHPEIRHKGDLAIAC